MHRSLFYGFMAGLLAGGLVLYVLASTGLIRLYTPHYAYVDIEKVIASLNKTLQEADFSVEEANKKIAEAKHIFQEQLDAYRKEHHAIIFSSPKVIAGAQDITSLMLNTLLKGLAKQQRNGGKS
jgi:type-F conjugative transfer system protein TrbI